MKKISRHTFWSDTRFDLWTLGLACGYSILPLGLLEQETYQQTKKKDIPRGSNEFKWIASCKTGGRQSLMILSNRSVDL